MMKYLNRLQKYRAYVAKRNEKNRQIDELIRREYRMGYSKAETLLHACMFYGKVEVRFLMLRKKA